MLRAIIQHLKRDNRGVSNVIIVMLSLVLIVIIVANVVLWSYQMNQFDWERMQEKVEILDIKSVGSSSWFVAQSEFTVNTGNRVNGSYIDTHTINDQYETFTEGFAEHAWLTGWHKRIKITINHNNVLDALSNFPLLLLLSNSSGQDKTSVSCVFDELQSGDARKKIAVTAGDGETQCYVEIEKWDDSNKKAWIWVKVPNMSSSQDTVLYLYYDKNHPDNTFYIGDPHSPAAESVWDTNFKLVLHLHESSGTQHDSTSNNNDGLPQGGVTENASGMIDGADQFDGTDDRIQIGDSPSLSFTSGGLTMEAWMKFNSLPTRETVIARKDNQWQLGFIDSNTIRNLVSTDRVTGWTVANDEHYTFQINTWYYCTFVYDGSKIVDKINGDQVGATHVVTGNIIDNSNPVYVAYCVYINDYLNGTIDEIRISDTARSAAWVRASYESERDNLVSYGSEESVGGERYTLDVVGAFSIDPSVCPSTYIQTVEIQLRYRASDSDEKWYLKTYNWSAEEYSDNGFNYTAGQVPTTDWDIYSVNLTDQLRSYVSENGTIYIKLQDSQVDTNQTSVHIDFFAARVLFNGIAFTFQNKGPLTSHLVSLWVSNSTYHRRYDLDTFINPGDSIYLVRSDISLPAKPYTIKLVAEKGNIAIFAGN